MNPSILDRLTKWLAYRLPPRLVYFCGVRIWEYATAGGYATTDRYELTIDEALWRWEDHVDEPWGTWRAKGRERVAAPEHPDTVYATAPDINGMAKAMLKTTRAEGLDEKLK